MKRLIGPAVTGGLRPSRAGGYVVGGLIVGLLAAPATAFSAAQVSGTQETVSIDAQNSSVKEILAALSKEFNVHLQSTANLEKQITGTYEGSLRNVLSRLLEGYNFVIRSREGKLLVTVFGGGSGGSQTPANGVASNPPPSPTAPQTTVQAAVQPVPAAAMPQPMADNSTEPASANASQPSSPASGPTPTFMVAEGPGPVPTPPADSSAGPVAGPATTTMPMPTPGPAEGGASLPMPTAAPTPFPGITASTTSPPPVPNSSAPAADPPTPQKP